MVAFVGFIIIVITFILNRGLGKFVKSKSLKYYNKTQDIEKSLNYLRGFNKFYLLTFILTIIILILGCGLVFTEFFGSSKPIILISTIIGLLLYFLNGIMFNKIVIQTELEIKGSKKNKVQEKMLFKLIGWYIFMYLLFLITFINFINIATDIYFRQFGFGLYLKSGLVLLGCIISLLLSINEIKIFDMIFKGKPFINDNIEYFAQQLHPNINLYYFESNDLKMANAFTIQGKQKSIYISDFLANNITFDELKAVIAHELGHLELKHMVTRSRFIMLGYLLGIIIQYLTLALFNGNTLLSASFILIFLFVYYVILKNKLYQKQEHMADAFMLKAGIEKEDAIHLIEKLSSLNYIPRKWAKGDQLLKTHPSIDNRIKHLKSL